MLDTLHQHFKWSPGQMRLVLARLRALNLVRVINDRVTLTERGEQHVITFIRENLVAEHP